MEMMVTEPTIAVSSARSIIGSKSNDICNPLMKHIDDVQDKNKVNDHVKKKQVEMVKEVNGRDFDGEGVNYDMDVSIHNRDGDECDDDNDVMTMVVVVRMIMFHYLSIYVSLFNYRIHLLYPSFISIYHIYHF